MIGIPHDSDLSELRMEESVPDNVGTEGLLILLVSRTDSEDVYRCEILAEVDLEHLHIEKPFAELPLL